jgi:hypothetical protein
MKALIIGSVSMLALTGCGVNTYPSLNQCTDVLYYTPETPAYATLGAIVGSIGLGILSDGDVAMSMIGAGAGAVVGTNAAGGLHSHEVCPTSEVTYTEPEYEHVYEK